MVISEPMTLTTDYLLAALTAWFALRLYRAGRQQGVRAAVLWSGAFAASSLAALSGGTVHGFAHHLPPLASALLWKVTVYTVGMAAFCMVSAAAFGALGARPRRFVLLLAGLQFLVYAAWMAGHDDFRYVIYDYAPAMLVVLALQLKGLFGRRPDPAAPWIAAGILLSFVAAGIQASGLALHRHFNHNDLYHVVQMVAFWMLYHGALLQRDR